MVILESPSMLSRLWMHCVSGVRWEGEPGGVTGGMREETAPWEPPDPTDRSRYSDSRVKHKFARIYLWRDG